MAKMKPPSTDGNANWRRNDIQFPRLIAELNAAGVFHDTGLMEVLSESMDLKEADIMELVDRAESAWDEIKYVPSRAIKKRR